MIDITFFVPTLNEQKYISKVLENIVNFTKISNKNIELIIIDDKSTDNTREIIHNFINLNESNLIICRFIENKKKHGLARNFRTAVDLASGRQFRLINGDNSEPLESLLRIVDKSDDFDVSIPFYDVIKNRSLLRTLISKSFTLIINTITGKDIKYYNGAPLYATDILKDVKFFSNGMSYSAEVLLGYLKLSKNYRQIGVIGFDNQSSSWNIINIMQVFFTLYRILIKKV